MAVSSGSQLFGGPMEMVGHSRHSAPSSESLSTRSLACCLARVTTIFFPSRGRSSNHLSLDLKLTTPPTTMMAGALSPASFTLSTIVSRVPETVFCFDVVPQRTRATGVSGILPFSRSLFTIRGRFFTPMRKTRVPMPLGTVDQSMPDCSFWGSSWPVMNATVGVYFRWVSGIPA